LRDLTKYRLERSEEFLDESKMLLENGNFKGSINRSYYADFFIVSREEAETQYNNAAEFYEAVKKYLETMENATEKISRADA